MARRAAGLALLLLAASWPGKGMAYPCCVGGLDETFRESAAAAGLIVYGSVAPIENEKEASDCFVAGLLKSHRIARGKKVVRLSRLIEAPDRNNPPSFLLFCDVVKGKVDPFRGVPASPAVVGYLRGLLARKADDVAGRLSYCFAYLDHADEAVSGDAYLEFQKVSEEDLSKAARRLPPAKLRAWLKNPKTTPHRLMLYAYLLGHCGKPADKALVLGVVERLRKEMQGGLLDRILIGYTLLAPKEGWRYVRDILNKPGNDFTLRYSAQRTCRYFFTTRSDVIGKSSVLDAMRPLLDQEDIVDLAIDDLRKWKRWDFTARLLPLYGTTPPPVPVARRAILRYALQCPLPEAATFVAERRKADPKWVEEQEELLELEK
jgi:hypothetical protein